MSTLNQAFATGGGLATEATLEEVRDELIAIDAKVPALGQAAMAASSPVVIASDQSVVPVSGPLTDVQLRATAVPVSGPLTDVQLRATAVPVSGPLTDTELRASAVPVSVAALPLPTGAALEATQLANGVLLGAVTETAPVTDTASSGLNGRLQRIAQRITSLIALVPASLGSKTSANSFAVVVASDQAAIATKAPVNTAGSAANTSLTGTTASTATAPANAVGFILYADTDNTHTIRFAIGATASTSVGGRLEPGRDTGYLPCAANVSVCAITSGTNAFFIQWILSA